MMFDVIFRPRGRISKSTWRYFPSAMVHGRTESKTVWTLFFRPCM